MFGQLTNVRVSGSGQITPTINFGCPGVGPFSLVLPVQNFLTTGIQQSTVRTLISDGSQPITIQWAVTIAAGGSPVLDLYAPIIFCGPLA